MTRISNYLFEYKGESMSQRRNEFQGFVFVFVFVIQCGATAGILQFPVS